MSADCTAAEAPNARRSWFGSPEDVDAYYREVEASPLYAEFFRPDADDIRQRRIEHSRKRRVRKPTLRSAMAQARRAGLAVSGAVVRADGAVELTFGEVSAANESANPWDTVINNAKN